MTGLKVLYSFRIVGKTTLARIIAKCITCSNLDNQGNPCDNCKYCNDINNEQFTICCYEYNASNLGIEEMRDIEKQAMTKSLTPKGIKVFFIDELQEMGGQGGSKKAQKNILKLLEKKRPNVYFLLGAMDDSKVDKAIKNRCVTYRLQDLSFEDIAQALYNVTVKEGIEVDEKKSKALVSIADNSEGSLRTALSYLERCVKGDLWGEAELKKQLSLFSKENLLNFTGKVVSGDMTAMSDPVNEVVIKNMKSLLNLTYKAQNGVELNSWQKGQVKSLPTLNKNKVRKTIQELNDLAKYPYLTTDLLEFTLINIISDNQDNDDSSSVKMRRKPVT